MPRIPSLDGLRGIAVLMVMLNHTGDARSGWFGQIASFGQTGVDLFFVLSGFLITRILIESRGEDAFLRNFYARRVLRIWPLYYAFLVLTYFVFPRFDLAPEASFDRQAWYWLYLQNLPTPVRSWDVSEGPGHFWSLAVEEHFYLVWPWIVAWAVPRRLWIWALAAIVVSVALRVVFTHQRLGIYYFTPCRLDGLALGALLAIVESRGRLQRWRGVWIAGFWLSALALFFLWPKIGGRGAPWVQGSKFFVISALYAGLIGIAATSSGALSAVLRSRALVECGKVSYGMYVYHVVCFEIARRIGVGHGFLWAVCAFALTFAVAELSFRVFERPFLAWKTRFEHAPRS